MGIGRRRGVTLALTAVAYVAVVLAGAHLGRGAEAGEAALAVGLAAYAMWVVTTTWLGGSHPYHPKASMFRSQWQVPVYAAVAAFVTTALGGYLKSLGAEGACRGWPLCGPGALSYPTSVIAAHYVHRAAAGLSGLLLIYTVGFVWKRHQNRPVVLVLTAISVVLFTVQSVLGVQSAQVGLSPLLDMGQMAVATGLICMLVALAAVGYWAPSLPAIGGASLDVAMPLPQPLTLGETAKAYLATMKPRVLVLLLITGFFGMWVAAGHMPPLGLTLVTMLGLFLSCGAANAINMWYDRDIDSIMSRTQKRPIPTGKLTPGQVLAFGVMVGALAFVLLAYAVNLLTAVLATSGLLFYVLIYTMWLKRTSVQNIVIGGAAGAVPPLVGWAAVTGQMSWAAWIMFLIIFMWTPPHFWALALYKNDDYKRANIPMMPAVKGEMYTKQQMAIYALLLIPTAMSLYWTGVVGQIYLWGSAIVSLIFFGATLVLLRERLPEKRWAIKTFKWSLYYLTLIFLLMAVNLKGKV